MTDKNWFRNFVKQGDDLNRNKIEEINISPLGLGTVKFGRNTQVKYPSSFAIPDDKQIQNIFAFCYEQGINLIDTAPAYGSSEERIGQLLPCDQEWIICSKGGEIYENGISRFDFSRKALTLSVENSLRRLKRETLDIFLIHSDGNDCEIIEQFEIFETLNQLKKVGKIRLGGMSTKTTEGGIACIEHADCAMVCLNPTYKEDLPIIEKAHQMNKGILIKKAFKSGHLGSSVQVKESLELCLTTPGVSSVIFGSINLDHIRSNIEIARELLL